MAGDPIYLKEGCTLYRCQQVKDGEGHTCDETYQCEDTIPGRATTCEFKKTDDVQYKIAVGDDGSATVIHDIYGTEQKIGKFPDSRALSLSGDLLQSVSRFDLSLLQSSWDSCSPDTGMPMSVKFSDGPRGAKGFGTVLVTPSAKRAIPIFTIPGSGSSGGALRLTSWLQKKLRQRQSELMQDSKVVIIYYPSTMEEEALKTAEEYISQGIYAMPLRLQDETIYRYEEDGSTGFVTAESKKLTKARKKSLTIAYLPTADIRVPEWRSDDPNDRISQNNALASRLVDRALGHSSAETIYSHYLYAFGLCDKKIEGFDFEEG